MVKVVFHGAKQEADTSIKQLVDDLKESQEYLEGLKSDDIIAFFDALAKHWKGNRELEQAAGVSLKHIAEYFSEASVKEMLSFALRGDYHVLDECTDLGHSRQVFTCHPRGLVAHWLSGNVAVLGLYSVFQATLTKNVSIVKASSRAYEGLVVLLDSLKEVKTKSVDGENIANSIAVVLIDREDKKSQEELSLCADVRIAWGGHEAIESIVHLKKNIFCEDVVFGPKYSYAVVHKDTNHKKSALRLAFDISTFDQYACSSPHTIFLESGKISAEEFGQILADALAQANKMIPKGAEDPSKKMEIMTLRTKATMTGKVFASENTDWTVIVSQEEGFAEACFSRVVHIKEVSDLSSVASLKTRKMQSIGMSEGMSDDQRFSLARDLTKNGGDRAPRFGEMTLYDSPWDGCFPIERLVRWVSTWK